MVFLIDFRQEKTILILKSAKFPPIPQLIMGLREQFWQFLHSHGSV